MTVAAAAAIVVVVVAEGGPRMDHVYFILNLCRYSYCEKCFNEIVGDEVELVDDPNQPVM